MAAPSTVVLPSPTSSRRSLTRGLGAAGEWLRLHPRTIQTVQWIVVVAYVFLVAVPAFLPLPPEDAHWYNNLTVLAQWLFWGVWWPFVILSMFVFGRGWCGLFCPEGTLTEVASKYGLGRAVPRWMRWGGWPFVAFALTTVFGQLVSVYQYATATLLVLGGSTVAAIAVGLVYGRSKRVWCRHLCPVNGVFAVLSRVAPMHFAVDTAAWTDNAKIIPVHPVNCAPMVRIKRMTGPSECHMCGRCSGLHGAIALTARSPNHEVATLDPRTASGWDAALIVFGMIGLAMGAFEWSALSAFVTFRTAAAELVIDHGPSWLLAENAPWWLLTNYPAAHDVFTWLDGGLILTWIVGTAALVGGWISAWLAIASRRLPGTWRSNAFALSYALIPLAGVGVFVGLSGLTATLAHNEGLRLFWLSTARAILLSGGALWSLWLAHRQLRARVQGSTQWWSLAAFGVAVGGALAGWAPFVFRGL
jgi:polyferredoxin